MTDTVHSSTLADRSAALLSRLEAANAGVARRYPGDRPDRQPVHTVYGGAQLYKASTTRRLGEIALSALSKYTTDPFDFAKAMGLPGCEDLGGAHLLAVQTRQFESDPAALQVADPAAWLAFTVHARVKEKLTREPVEDFRIDFEDGFGHRPDAEEDAEAVRAATEMAQGMKAGALPPFIGIRIKSLDAGTARRAVRTLDLFVRTAVAEGGALPANFVVTLPKITHRAQVEALVGLFEKLEEDTGLAPGTLKFEIMVELTQTLLGADGRCLLPELLDAGAGRMVGAHFGTYDYTACFDITAAFQTMDHDACRFALHWMKLAYAGTGVFLSDGATNVMPVPIHRAGPDGGALTAPQIEENRASVHAAWQLASAHARGSLINGIYQGWDLHPAQLVSRYATCYAFFLEGFAAAANRLSNFMQKAAQATLVGDVFDDAATGQGLLNYFLRALNCGAVDLSDLAATGLTLEEVRTRSFKKILDGRQ